MKNILRGNDQRKRKKRAGRISLILCLLLTIGLLAGFSLPGASAAELTESQSTEAAGESVTQDTDTGNGSEDTGGPSVSGENTTAVQSVTEPSLPETSATEQEDAEDSSDLKQTAQSHPEIKPGDIRYVKATTTTSTGGLTKAQKKKSMRMVKIYWTKADNASEYQIYYSSKRDSGYKKATAAPVAGKADGSWLRWDLPYKKDKVVYFKVCGVNGASYGNSSVWFSIKAGNTKKNVKKVTVKRYAPNLFVGQGSRVFTASVSPSKCISGSVRWISSNPEVASVSANGAVTGLKPGTATIYAYAHDGVKTGVQVTVVRDGVETGILPPAPALTYVSLRPQKISDKNAKVNVVWQAKSGNTYRVYRKSNGGSFEALATVKATAATASYVDSSAAVGTRYTYTVRQIVKNGSFEEGGAYDKEGITTLPPVTGIKASMTNLEAVINWNKVSGASGYKVFRKQTRKGAETWLGTGSVTESRYEDVYWKSFTTAKEKACLKYNYFLDPSVNCFLYNVRAEKKITDSYGSKTSYSFGYADGDFCLESPTVISFGFAKGKKKGTLKWAQVPLADGYILYAGKNTGGGFSWKKLATVKNGSAKTLSKSVKYDKNYPYYTVKAYAAKNGETINSGYDQTFVVNKRNYSSKKVLFIGDSITFGTPYSGTTSGSDPYYAGKNGDRYIYSYVRRFAQITGAKYCNVAIAGATYKAQPPAQTNPRGLVNMVGAKLAAKAKITTAINSNCGNPTSFADYDVVVLAGGTNDYGWSVPLSDAGGNINNTDTENFTGALNTILNYAEAGSRTRIGKGKEPIKVVFVDLFYSDCTVVNGKNKFDRNNRFTTVNSAGLTLTDYQAQIARIIAARKAKYASADGQEKGKPALNIYRFTHNQITAANCGTATADNLHLTKFSYGQFGSALANYMTGNKILTK